jgi:sugar phosphate isomerase/epimerase
MLRPVLISAPEKDMEKRHPKSTKSTGAGRTPGIKVARRTFVSGTTLGALGLAAGLSGCSTTSKQELEPSASLDSKKHRVAFNTANLVARETDYHFKLENWGDQHSKTVAATDEAAWRDICTEIAATGFPAVEIWEAHASPDSLDKKQIQVWKQILEDHGLHPIAYAGSLSRGTLQFCQWLDIQHVDGGLGDLDPDQATRLCEEMGIRFNLENHPEKNSEEILQKIGGGNEWLGVCVDTGWLGTQSAPVPETILAIGEFVRHNHIKDVKDHGGHDTCLLGEGVAQVEVCMKAFQEIGYDGWYSWEDEPEDRNPFDSAVRNREWIERHLV